MSLVSGPGRGGVLSSPNNLPGELGLFIDSHVKYIKSLDTVCYVILAWTWSPRSYADSAETSWSIG